MTPRERVRRALEHREPDRVSLDLGGSPTTIIKESYEELKKFLGIEVETKLFGRMDRADPNEEILQRFGIDTRYIRINPPRAWKLKLEPDNSYVDEWGTRWKKPDSSLYYDPVDFPLKEATLDAIKNYNWPDPYDPGRTEGLKEKVEFLYRNTDYALVADMVGLGIFETGWMLRGFENFLADMAGNREFAWALLEKITEVKIGLYDHLLNAVGNYVQVVMTSDDLGWQGGPLISPQFYRDMLKPFHKRLWQFIKSKTKAKLFLHSCGSVYHLIPDLIECGLDILNPVQPLAKDMDTKRLKERFGDKLSFWGGIDTQKILPYGTPQEVKEEVKRRIEDLASGGGYVLCAAHNIQLGVRPENICAMYESALEYGRYPIHLA